MTTTVNINQIAANIDAHIRKCGGGYPSWYVGIATDPRERLFRGHNVDEKNGAWIYKDAGNDTNARAIEDHFIKKGCKGGDGGGSTTSRYVYAYKITSTTRE